MLDEGAKLLQGIALELVGLVEPDDHVGGLGMDSLGDDVDGLEIGATRANVQLASEEADDADEGDVGGGEVDDVVAMTIEAVGDVPQELGLAHAGGAGEEGVEARPIQSGLQHFAGSDIVGQQ